MRQGFTLIEVVIALLLLEVGVLAAAGTLEVASRILAEAERVERVVVEIGGVLDSLARIPGPATGGRTLPFAELSWSVDSTGVVVVRGESAEGALLAEVTSDVGWR